MSSAKQGLVIVAHPDDETIFFGGLLLTQRQTKWTVLCITDGNGLGRGAERSVEFQSACRRLGVKGIQWNFIDDPKQRLDVEKLRSELAAFNAKPGVIYTHGPLGEYGHPHHQDVSFAAHQVFRKTPLYSVSTHVWPTQCIRLSPQIFKKKTATLLEVYRKESERILQLLPVSTVEGFCRLDADESAMLYGFLAEGGPLVTKKMKVYRPILDFIGSGAVARAAKSFFVQ